jgi:hypothetical protein
MLVAVDGTRGVAEAMVESNAVTVGQASAIGGAHAMFLASDGGFAAFEMSCLASGELAASYALRNAVLLVLTALVDVGALTEGNGGAKCENSDAN